MKKTIYLKTFNREYMRNLMIVTKLMIIPSLGLRYDFTEHWEIEAGGGWGWRKYGKSKNYFGITSEEEYSLSAGLRYTF